MASILGLPDSKKFNDQAAYFKSHRREVLHRYPKGGCTLTGILGQLASESVGSYEHIWYEKEWVQPTTTLRGTAPITSSEPTTGDADTGTNLANGALAVSTNVWIKVNSTEYLRPGQIIELSDAATGNRPQFQVLEVVRGVSNELANGYVKARAIEGITITGNEDSAGNIVRVITTAYQEGAGGSNVRALGLRLPYSVSNYTQISRTPFTFSASVLQQGLKFDQSGPYRERAKEAVLEHMVGLERALLFGKRSIRTQDPFVDSADEANVIRTMSGIFQFMEAWDKGSVGISVSVDGANTTWAPYNTHGDQTTGANNGDGNARKTIITNASGSMSENQLLGFLERNSLYHGSKTNEKLVLCGNGAIIAIHALVKNSTQFNVTSETNMYGLDILSLKTPFMTLHFVTHPMFNTDPVMRYWMLLLDIHSLRWMPLQNRDTKLLKNRQDNGDDFRKDEYLTEATLEFANPQSAMLIKNCQTFTA